MTTVVDEKLKTYRALQEGAILWRYFSRFLYESPITISCHVLLFSVDIQKLFVAKQNALSQFNENTLVKGVRCIVHYTAYRSIIRSRNHAKFDYYVSVICQLQIRKWTCWTRTAKYTSLLVPC